MEIMKKSNLSVTLFCLYLGKTFIIPATWSDALIIAVLGAVTAYFEFKIQSKELTDLNEKLSRQEKDIDYLKSQLAGLKLASGMRNLSGGR